MDYLNNTRGKIEEGIEEGKIEKSSREMHGEFTRFPKGV
jgi:hypothetical protein